MGDFLGFTFGNVHSSDLGITRVSGGDRYDEQLHPEIKDRTAEVPGVNGNYYFGSDFGPKTIDLEIAFDHLTEKQFRVLRKTFGTKEIQKLIFDERPYKYYMAKLESPVELSYICFDEKVRKRYSEIHNIGTVDPNIDIPGSILEELPNGIRMIDDGTGNRVREKVDPWVYEEATERIYKGEGKITFICYFPFAKSVFKQLPYMFQLTQDESIQSGKKYYTAVEVNGVIIRYDEVSEPVISEIETYYERVNQTNTKDWAISSGILPVYYYENVDKYNNGNITIYNAGDISTGFRLYCPFVENNNSRSTAAITLTYQQGSGQNLYQAILQLNEFEAKPCEYDNQGNPIKYDIGFLIDTNTGLITGIQPQSITTGTIVYDPRTYELVEASQEVTEAGIIYDRDGNASYITTGNLYNEYVESGYFFKFEPDNIYDGTEFNSNSILTIENGIQGIEIFYDYLYF